MSALFLISCSENHRISGRSESIIEIIDSITIGENQLLLPIENDENGRILVRDLILGDFLICDRSGTVMGTISHIEFEEDRNLIGACFDSRGNIVILTGSDLSKYDKNTFLLTDRKIFDEFYRIENFYVAPKRLWRIFDDQYLAFVFSSDDVVRVPTYYIKKQKVFKIFSFKNPTVQKFGDFPQDINLPMSNALSYCMSPKVSVYNDEIIAVFPCTGRIYSYDLSDDIPKSVDLAELINLQMSFDESHILSAYRGKDFYRISVDVSGQMPGSINYMFLLTDLNGNSLWKYPISPDTKFTGFHGNFARGILTEKNISHLNVEPSAYTYYFTRINLPQ